MKLESLTIDAFRGATRPFTLPFVKGDKSKRITVLYGPNGSGKTTIIDALQVLAENDSKASLTDKSVGAGYGHFVAKGRKKVDTSVVLKTSEGTWKSTLEGKGFKTTPSPDRLRFKVLRRADLAGLINEKPGQRYERFKRFIDTDAIEKSEEALRKRCNGVKADFESATTLFRSSQAALEQEWLDLGKPEQDFRQWLRVVMSAEENDERRQWMSAFEALQKTAQSLADRVPELTVARGQLSTAATAHENAQQAENLVRLSFSDASLADARDVLLQAQSYLQKRPAEQDCPVCGKPESATALLESVSLRLASMVALEEAVKRTTFAKKAQEAAQSALERVSTNLSDAFKKLATVWREDLRTIYPEIPPEGWKQLDNAADLTALLDHFGDKLPQIAKKAQEERDNLHKALALQDSVRSRVAQARELKKKAQTLETMQARLPQALSIVQNIRKAYVEGILASLTDDAARIFEAIHPGEGFTKVCLLLDEKKRGSLMCEDEAGENPAAFYSEAHVDTLGLAIFMAEALREAPERTILILDDVVSSVDEDHLRRIVRMLYAEGRRFAHILMTTHYRPWREQFRFGILQHKDAQMFELLAKVPGGGIGIQSLTRPEREQLRDSLADSNATPVRLNGDAGVLLEALLHYLTHLYRGKLPCGQHERGWTLGEYFGGIGKKLKPALVSQKLHPDGTTNGPPTQLGPLLDDLKDWSGMRNMLGCHFNPFASQIPPEDAREFAHKVLALADAMVDANGELPTSDKSGTVWMTSSKLLQLSPLKEPG